MSERLPADVTGLRARAVREGVVLEWDWPDGCSLVRVARRTDGWPAGPAGPGGRLAVVRQERVRRGGRAFRREARRAGRALPLRRLRAEGRPRRRAFRPGAGEGVARPSTGSPGRPCATTSSPRTARPTGGCASGGPSTACRRSSLASHSWRVPTSRARLARRRRRALPLVSVDGPRGRRARGDRRPRGGPAPELAASLLQGGHRRPRAAPHDAHRAPEHLPPDHGDRAARASRARAARVRAPRARPRRVSGAASRVSGRRDALRGLRRRGAGGRAAFAVSGGSAASRRGPRSTSGGAASRASSAPPATATCRSRRARSRASCWGS